MTSDLNATFGHRPFIKDRREAVDRVLSYIVDLRRSPSLFFIPLEPYPARSARHLPHAGKALCREKRYPRFAAFPIGEGGPRQRWIGCSRLSST